MLPRDGVAPIIAADHRRTLVGAVDLLRQPATALRRRGTPLPQLCIAVAPGYRGAGIGAQLLDALFTTLAADRDPMRANVHVRNPAKRLDERKRFRVVGQGNGPLAIALIKDLR